MPKPPAGASVTALSKTSLDLFCDVWGRKGRHWNEHIKNIKKPDQEMQEHNILTKMQGKIKHQNFGNFWPTLLMLSWQDHSLKVIPGCFLSGEKKHSVREWLFNKPLSLHSHPWKFSTGSCDSSALKIFSDTEMSKKDVPVRIPGGEIELNVGITNFPNQIDARGFICFLCKHR